MIARMLFVGRPWPISFGAGIGIGMGYANCQHDFATPQLMYGQLKKVNQFKLNLACYLFGADLNISKVTIVW